jgi:predicted DNA-binding transcriptional regulator AlpA
MSEIPRIDHAGTRSEPDSKSGKSRILRINELQALVGLSRSTIWRMERKRTFPRRVRISTNAVGWLEFEVQAWLASRPRG